MLRQLFAISTIACILCPITLPALADTTCTTDKAGTTMCVIYNSSGKLIGTTLSRLNGRSRVVPVRKAAALPSGQPKRTFGGGTWATGEAIAIMMPIINPKCSRFNPCRKPARQTSAATDGPIASTPVNSPIMCRFTRCRKSA
jgi:hypothetical protein